ncbi:hypothetical protein GCM10029992_10840 [Glycomyces albus]
MYELDAALVVAGQVVDLGRFEVGQVRAEPLGGLGDHGGLSGLLGGGDQQQGAGGLGEGDDALGERLLDAGGGRVAAVGGVDGVDGVLVVGRRQFQERERVALGQAQDPVAAGEGDGLGAGVQDRPGRLVVERAEGHLGDAGGREVGGEAVADDQDHRDRLRRQAPGGEQEGVGGVAVEPVGVVDDDVQGLVGRGLDQEVQHGQADLEPLDAGGALAHAQGGAEGFGLGGREAVDVLQQRVEQHLESGVGPGVLGFDAEGAQDGEAVGQVDGGVGDRGLADAGFAADDQCAAVADAGAVEEGVDGLQFRVASVEDRPGRCGGAGGGVHGGSFRGGMRTPPRVTGWSTGCICHSTGVGGLGGYLAGVPGRSQSARPVIRLTPLRSANLASRA